MFRSKFFIFTLVLIAVNFLAVIPAKAVFTESLNLVPNSSLEIASGSNPLSWQSNSWGGNTAVFTYLNTGHTGNRSVKTEITSYVGGDAKWYFDPVNVTFGTNYSFSDFYQSSIATEVVAQYTNSSGHNTYQWLGTAPASTGWNKFEGSFTTPSDTIKVSVFHVIAGVGTLVVDDMSLTVTEVSPPSSTNLIPNPSLETANNNMPASWSTNSWGSNSAKFQYVNSGRTGSKSIKVTVSNYVSGDAKWYFNPITNLERGKQYRFSTWYKTNTTPQVVAMFIKDDNTEKYFGMPQPFPNGSRTSWQFYSDTFSVPVDAKAVSVFMFINKNGWVQTDDYEIVPYQPIGFNRPLVTLTFDDGDEDNVNTALPILGSYGFKSTQCYATEYIEGQPQAIQNVMAFFNSGHEICSHTVSHPFLTRVSRSQLNYELSHSKEVLEGIIGQPVKNFASPYGDYNAYVNSQISKYYRSHRTVDEGYNSKDNFNIYRLRVQNVQFNTTLAEYRSWLDAAKRDNTWLILVYHRITDNPGQFDTYISDFNQQMQALANSGLTVKTFNGALDEITAQL
jgi:peptidoglycan/xylan/chitin deacetylase (PgdA/CDA1 family)